MIYKEDETLMEGASRMYAELESTVRQTYASVVWSHKIQEKQADIYMTRFSYMEIAKIILASITSVGIISVLFIDDIWIKAVTTLVSFCSVFITSYFKSFDLQNLISQHKQTANNLLKCRDDLLVLLMKVRQEICPLHELNQLYEVHLINVHKIYSDAPSTTKKAVQQARKSLKINQDNTFSNSEIDGFLPIELRRDV